MVGHVDPAAEKTIARLGCRTMCPKHSMTVIVWKMQGGVAIKVDRTRSGNSFPKGNHGRDQADKLANPVLEL